MRDERFDGTYLPCAWGCTDAPWSYPHTTGSYDLYATSAARVRVELTPVLGAGLSFCRSPLQETATCGPSI